MQSNIQLRPNVVRVVDCIEYLLQQIKPANNNENMTYYTDGVVVDRKRDPRKITQDKVEDYRALGTLVRISLGSRKLGTGNDGSQLGVMYRKSMNVNLYCFQVLSQEQDIAGVTEDLIQDWLEHDITWTLANSMNGMNPIQRASYALNTIAGSWGPIGTFGGPPSCINWKYHSTLAGPVAGFPNLTQMIQFTFDYDEFGPAGTPGTL